MNRPHYIIDGYNVIHAIPAWKRTLVQDAVSARELLIHAASRLTHERKIRCTIVFDGSPAPADRKTHTHAPVHVVHAFPLSADARIKEMITQSKNRSLLVVITSDREILNYARACSCQTHTSTHFANLLSSSEESTTEKSDSPLTKGQIDEWLRIFGESHRPSDD